MSFSTRSFATSVRRGKRHAQRLVLETLESRLLYAADFQYEQSSLDVNRSGTVTAVDALLVIHELVARPTSNASAEPAATTILPYSNVVEPFEFDVSQDGNVSALDALIIVNYLNSLPLADAPLSKPEITRLPSEAGTYRFQLSGDSNGHSTIQLNQVGLGVVTTIQPDAEGQWSFIVDDAALIDRRFSFSASAIDEFGSVISASPESTYQPNFVLVNVDDMRADSLPHLDFLNNSLLPESTNYINSFVPTALSGPSRASLLTGLYAHRTGVLGNGDSIGGGLNDPTDKTFATRLDELGYNTGLFGKDRTLPGNDVDHGIDVLSTREGWDRYFANTIGGVQGYNTTFTDNGIEVKLGPDEYLTDRIFDEAIGFAQQSQQAGLPFLAYIATFAPHAPGAPAHRHFGAFTEDLETPPSFNIPDPGANPLSERDLELNNKFRQGGIESLYAVDEGIERLFDHLTLSGQLDNTVFVFTSDHGLFYGEHALVGKQSQYDESIRVPIMVWDGRLPLGGTVDSIALSLDLGPTMVDLAGGTPDIDIDGVSLVPSLVDPNAVIRDDFLVTNWVYDFLDDRPAESLRRTTLDIGVRSIQFSYVVKDDGTERLFDLANDPYELTNLGDSPDHAETLEYFRGRLSELSFTDHDAPLFQSFSLSSASAANQSDVLQPFNLLALVDDSDRGGSQVRTPELLFDPEIPEGLGIPLAALDGAYDSTTEWAQTQFPWSQWLAADRPSYLWLRSRDAPGNFSEPMQIDLSFLDSPELVDGIATSETSSDRLTLDETPTFQGIASPGAEIGLFIALEDTTDFALFGTAAAGPDGDWQIAGILPSTGRWVVLGQVIHPDDAGNQATDFMSPLYVHLVASGTNPLVVTGTQEDDFVRIVTNDQGHAEIFVSDISVGSIDNVLRVQIAGLGGDDSLFVEGPLPSYLHGGLGNDILRGGDGIDTLVGHLGSNTLYGGGGGDRYFMVDILQGDFRDPVNQDLISDPDGDQDWLIFNRRDPLSIELGPSTDPAIVSFETNLRVNRSIVLDSETPTSKFVRVISGPSDDVIRVLSQTNVDAGAGNDAIEIFDGIKPGSTVVLRTFSSGFDVG